MKDKRAANSQDVEESKSSNRVAGNLVKIPKKGSFEYLLASQYRFWSYDDVRQMRKLTYKSSQGHWLAGLRKEQPVEESKKEAVP